MEILGLDPYRSQMQYFWAVVTSTSDRLSTGNKPIWAYEHGDIGHIFRLLFDDPFDVCSKVLDICLMVFCGPREKSVERHHPLG